MADGKIVFETAIDQKGMKQDLAGIQRGTGGLHKALGKIGLAIGAAFSVAKVVQFGKACINLGSDLQDIPEVRIDGIGLPAKDNGTGQVPGAHSCPF